MRDGSGSSCGPTEKMCIQRWKSKAHLFEGLLGPFTHSSGSQKEVTWRSNHGSNPFMILELLPQLILVLISLLYLLFMFFHLFLFENHRRTCLMRVFGNARRIPWLQVSAFLWYSSQSWYTLLPYEPLCLQQQALMNFDEWWSQLLRCFGKNSSGRSMNLCILFAAFLL